MRLISLLFVAMFSIFFAANCSYAEIRFLHDSSQVKLPFEGSELQLNVTLVGTRRADYPLEVEVIKDGRLTHLLVEEASFNKQEKPTYNFSISSPAAGLGYRFKVTDENQKVWISQYYFLLQQCESVAAHNNVKIEELELQSDKVNYLAAKSALLERDIASYSLAVKRLSELSAMFKEDE